MYRIHKQNDANGEITAIMSIPYSSKPLISWCVKFFVAYIIKC